MAQTVAIDKARTAVVIMDFQKWIVQNHATEPEAVVRNAAKVLGAARGAGIPIVYVVARGPTLPTGPEAEIHPGVAPAHGEPVVAKTKVAPFSTTGFDGMLRGMGRDALVLMGVSTSGCVLSTVRWAFDVNYKLFVVADACSDRDAEVHRVLTEKVYPRQATVLTAEEFVRLVG